MLLRQRRISGQGPSFTFFYRTKLQLSPVGMNSQSQRPCLSSLPLVLLPRARTQQILIPLHRVSLKHRMGVVCVCVNACAQPYFSALFLRCPTGCSLTSFVPLESSWKQPSWAPLPLPAAFPQTINFCFHTHFLFGRLANPNFGDGRTPMPPCVHF